MVTTTEVMTKTAVFGDACGAQGASLDDLLDGCDSGRANGCLQRLLGHVGCCRGWRGPSTRHSVTTDGPSGRRAAASALSGSCDALSAHSNAPTASTLRYSCKLV